MASWGEMYDRKVELAAKVVQFRLCAQPETQFEHMCWGRPCKNGGNQGKAPVEEKHIKTGGERGDYGTGIGRNAQGARIARKRRGLFANWRTRRAQRKNDKARAEITHKPSIEFMNLLHKDNQVYLGDLGGANYKKFTKGDLDWMKKYTKDAADSERSEAAHYGGNAIASAFTPDNSRAAATNPYVRRSNTAQYAAWSAAASQRAKAWDSQRARITGEQLRRNRTVLQGDEVITFEAETVEFANSELSLDDWLGMIEYLEDRIAEGITDPALAESAPLIIADIEDYLDGKFEEEPTEE